MGLLENKIAIVTGAGSGIGEASARRFAAEGAAVVAVDIRPAKAAEVAESIVAQGGHAISLAANVAEAADVESMVDQTVDQLGGLESSFVTGEHLVVDGGLRSRSPLGRLADPRPKHKQ